MGGAEGCWWAADLPVNGSCQKACSLSLTLCSQADREGATQLEFLLLWHHSCWHHISSLGPFSWFGLCGTKAVSVLCSGVIMLRKQPSEDGNVVRNWLLTNCRNLKTGQLLKKMHVGYSYPASICHRAYSDSVRTQNVAQETCLCCTGQVGTKSTGLSRGAETPALQRGVKHQLSLHTLKRFQRQMA